MKSSMIIAGVVMALLVSTSFHTLAEANTCYLTKCHLYFTACMDRCATVNACTDCIMWKWSCIANNCEERVFRRRRSPEKNLRLLYNAFKSQTAKK